MESRGFSQSFYLPFMAFILHGNLHGSVVSGYWIVARGGTWWQGFGSGGFYEPLTTRHQPLPFSMVCANPVYRSAALHASQRVLAPGSSVRAVIIPVKNIL